MIVRTVGEDVTQETFQNEITTLINQWAKINKKTKFVGNPPKLLHRETSLTRGIIRDLFSEKIDALTVDSKQIFNEIVEYLQGIAPELVDRVKLYEEKVPLFDKADIETEIRDLFKRRCDLPSGGYIIIEPTEALVSIDVNSGRFVGKKDPEKTIFKTNSEAAREIARQLRLRDIGGIIVCDFIDMETRQNRERVLNELRTHLGRDRARTKAFAVSDLGLIEMTRQRVRQSHLQSMTESCPTCNGTGPGLHAGDDRAPDGALGAPHRGRGAARQPGREAPPGHGDLPARERAGPAQEAGEGARVLAGDAGRPAAAAGRVQAGGEGGGEGCDAAVRGRVSGAVGGCDGGQATGLGEERRATSSRRVDSSPPSLASLVAQSPLTCRSSPRRRVSPVANCP